MSGVALSGGGRDHKEGRAVKRLVMSALLCVLWLASPPPLTLHAREGRQVKDAQPAVSSQPAADSKTLLYADFEKMENNRPVSARGGLIQMYSYEESAVHKSTFKGLDSKGSRNRPERTYASIRKTSSRPSLQSTSPRSANNAN